MLVVQTRSVGRVIYAADAVPPGGPMQSSTSRPAVAAGRNAWAGRDARRVAARAAVLDWPRALRSRTPKGGDEAVNHAACVGVFARDKAPIRAYVQREGLAWGSIRVVQ